MMGNERLSQTQTTISRRDFAVRKHSKSPSLELFLKMTEQICVVESAATQADTVE